MPIKNRYEFVLLVEARGCNPNGDPDMDNQPRMLHGENTGLITDVSIKRKIRDAVELLVSDETDHKNRIYFSRGAVLVTAHKDCIKKTTDTPNPSARQAWMLNNFWDIRTFGAVLSVGSEAGKGSKPPKVKLDVGGAVTGPVQLSNGFSVSPIEVFETAITRTSRTNEDEHTSIDDDGEAVSDHGQFGRRHAVVYGLYRFHGYISPVYAERTGFSEDDLKTLWSAMQQMFEFCRASGRTELVLRGLHVFKHTGNESQSRLGRAPAHKVLDCVHVSLKKGVTEPVQFSDYEVNVDKKVLPEGVEYDDKTEAASGQVATNIADPLAH